MGEPYHSPAPPRSRRQAASAWTEAVSPRSQGYDLEVLPSTAAVVARLEHLRAGEPGRVDRRTSLRSPTAVRDPAGPGQREPRSEVRADVRRRRRQRDVADGGRAPLLAGGGAVGEPHVPGAGDRV